MIAIIDYDAGNLKSVEKALVSLGEDVVGCVVAFVVSLAAIRFLMDYVKRHNFKFFCLYRIVLGLIVLAVAAITAIA